MYAVPRKVLTYAPGLNSQLYCPCVKCKNLSKFLNVTVGPDCCLLSPVDVSMLGKKYLPSLNIFLILKQTVGFHIMQVCMRELQRTIYLKELQRLIASLIFFFFELAIL